MDTLTKVRKLIGDNPQHAVSATRKLEQLYRSEPNDVGYRRVYFELRKQLDEQYPIKFPAATDVPVEAWDDESHPHWTTDPYTIWHAVYDRLKDEHGFTDAQILVSVMQRDGGDLLDYLAQK